MSDQEEFHEWERHLADTKQERKNSSFKALQKRIDDKHLHEIAATVAAGMIASDKSWCEDETSQCLLACKSADIACEIIRRCDESGDGK